MFLLCVLAASAGFPVPKETDAAHVVRVWGTPADADGGCKFDLVDRANLRVTAGKGPRGLVPQSGVNNAPRCLKSVTGDFTATVRITRDAAPAGALRGGDQFTLSGGGGILLWVSDDTHLRLSRSQWPGENGAAASSTYNLRGANAGDALADQQTVTKPESKPVGLKLARVGTTVTGSYTLDDKTWTPFTATELDLPETVKIGVYAAHNYDRPFEVVFEPLVVVVAPAKK